MVETSSTDLRLRTLLVVISFAILAAGCRTPDGPHFPIADQSLAIPIPEGLTRVVFLNTNYPSEAGGSGPIRIQLDGRQIPSIWPERYVQAFIEPGEYDLLIEQSSGFFWKKRDHITIAGEELLIGVYKPSFSMYPAYEILDKLPSDFEEEFLPGRHPASW